MTVNVEAMRVLAKEFLADFDKADDPQTRFDKASEFEARIRVEVEFDADAESDDHGAALASGLNTLVDRPDAEFVAGVQKLLDYKPPLPESLAGDGWRQTPPDRDWLVDGWLPAGELVLLAGPGETGKSLLLMQIATALACDRDTLNNNGGWLPCDPSARACPPALCAEPATVVMAGWEDDRSESLRRRDRLARFGKLAWADDASINERLHVAPMRGYGPVIGIEEGKHVSTRASLTQTGRALLERCEALGACLLVLDPVSLAIATNENDRALVSLALESLAGWAASTGCAVLMAGHPSKASEGEAADYSGSTAWRGLVRALWTLRMPDAMAKPDSSTKAAAAKVKADYQRRKDRVATLALNKSNYSFSGGVSLTLETIGKCAAWRLRDDIELEADRPSKASKRGKGRQATQIAPVPDEENPYA